jgi:hypothetical protein
VGTAHHLTRYGGRFVYRVRVPLFQWWAVPTLRARTRTQAKIKEARTIEDHLDEKCPNSRVMGIAHHHKCFPGQAGIPEPGKEIAAPG